MSLRDRPTGDGALGAGLGSSGFAPAPIGIRLSHADWHPPGEHRAIQFLIENQKTCRDNHDKSRSLGFTQACFHREESIAHPRDGEGQRAIDSWRRGLRWRSGQVRSGQVKSSQRILPAKYCFQAITNWEWSSIPVCFESTSSKITSKPSRPLMSPFST